MTTRRCYAGWALGWDTGFDQFDGGNIFLGGFSANVDDDVTFIYMTTAGNLGCPQRRRRLQQHIVDRRHHSRECMTYVVQSDYVNANGFLDRPQL